MDFVTRDFNMGLAHMLAKAQNIAFVGKMGTGKSTLAQIFRSVHEYKIFSFAAEVKRIAEMILGRELDKTTDRRLLQDIGMILKTPYPDLTSRQVKLITEWQNISLGFHKFYQQQQSTEYIHTPDYYYHVLAESPKFDKASSLMRACIDDCRFVREVELLRKRGHFVIVKLEAPEQVRLTRLYKKYGDMNISLLLDESEQEIDKIDADVTIIQK